MSHPGFRLRDATRADLPAIVRMLADDPLGQKRHRVEDPLPQEYYMAFDAIAASPSNRLYVAEIEGEIAAAVHEAARLAAPIVARAGARLRHRPVT